jgi:DNA (cytosine-5)-methyltransferase 1
MRFIDLFSGMGGFRLALENENLNCVFSADNDKYACDTYKLNFNEYPLKDITKIEPKNIPDHEILCGGFPCQPFSMGGYRKGFEDIRGTLFFEIVKILKNKNPEIFILENVQGLINHDKGKTFKTILDFLATRLNGSEHLSSNKDNLGYNVFWNVLNTKDFNVPQNRSRVFIVGFKDPKVNFNFPEGIKRKLNLEDILDKKPEIKRISDQSYSYIHSFLKAHKKNNVISQLNYLIAYEIRKSRVAFRFDNNSPCLTTKMGTGGNNVPYLVNQNRFFTLKEGLKLQGFPEDFKLTNNYSASLRQIGNSVSVPVVQSIIKNIFN